MKLTHWAMIGLMASPIAANAFETRINGFLSVTGGMTLKGDQTFIPDPVNFVAYDNELSIKPETMVALQTRSVVNERLSATTQLVGFASNDFDVQIEWAYVNYQILRDVDLKVGRLRLPVFNYSSALDLGYSYAWVRPPVEVYNVFLTGLQGLSVDYSFLVGDWFTTASVYYGETDGNDPETGSFVEFESIFGGSVILNNGNLNIRLSHSTDDDVYIVRNALVPLPGQPGSFIFTEVTLPLPIDFSSASATYDNGTFLLNGEYTLTRFKNNLNNNEMAWYATAGLRVGSFTPHFTYASFKQDTNSIQPILVPTGTPNAMGIYNAASVAQIKSADFPQSMTSWTAGVRWDFDIAAAIKLEYTSRTDNTEEPAGFEGKWSPFGDAQVITVGVDVVF